MKTFKTVDFWIQIAVMIAGILIIITDPDNFYVAYFIVGAFQFASMLIHEAMHCFTGRGSTRRVYHNVTYILVVAMAMSPLLSPLLFVFLPLLFISPVMAIFYLRLC